MPVRSLIRRITDLAGGAIVGWYFAASYRALTTPAGREFLRTATAPGAPAVHGYTSADDVMALLEALQLSPDDVVIDLGCGVGEVAIAVHRRSGCRVVGIDASPRAIAEARRRADAADVSAAVRFEVGDVGSSAVRGSAAYALDSMMFIRRAPDVLASVSRSLEPPGRIFGTLIDHRSLDRDSIARYLAGSRLTVERVDDVTGPFTERNRRRAAAARHVLRTRPPLAGRLGLLLMLAEEAIVAWLIGRGRLRRWRFTVAGPSPATEDSPPHPRGERGYM